MESYPRITHALCTIFNAEDGLSLDVAKRLYERSVAEPNALLAIKKELAAAFADPKLSWRQMLSNESYEVLDVETEEEARAFAYEVLCTPLEHVP